jgi:hypothetical protein
MFIVAYTSAEISVLIHFIQTNDSSTILYLYLCLSMYPIFLLQSDKISVVIFNLKFSSLVCHVLLQFKC